MAKNFAFGTTAADIESAMTPVGGLILSCRIVTERPSVIAEIVFDSKDGADNVVDTFNNQNVSSGRCLMHSKLILVRRMEISYMFIIKLVAQLAVCPLASHPPLHRPYHLPHPSAHERTLLLIDLRIPAQVMAVLIGIPLESEAETDDEITDLGKRW